MSCKIFFIANVTDLFGDEENIGKIPEEPELTVANGVKNLMEMMN